jgi:hypothetical protein
VIGDDEQRRKGAQVIDLRQVTDVAALHRIANERLAAASALS